MSGDVVFSQTDMYVTSVDRTQDAWTVRMHGPYQTEPCYGYSTVTVTRDVEEPTEESPFNSSKTYDVIIREH